MDEIALEQELESGQQRVIMTTWHADESLDEATTFALEFAVPDTAEAVGCEAVVLAAVGNPAWAQALKGIAHRYLSGTERD